MTANAAPGSIHTIRWTLTPVAGSAGEWEVGEYVLGDTHRHDQRIPGQRWRERRADQPWHSNLRFIGRFAILGGAYQAMSASADQPPGAAAR